MSYYDGRRIMTVFPSLANYAKIDGYYALLGAGVADNLRGGPASAVPAFFTFRPSGGTADIGNPKATIRSIHGKTLKWEQLCQNGNFASEDGWNFVNASGSVSDNVATVTPTSASININRSITYTATRKILYVLLVKSSKATDAALGDNVSVFGNVNLTANTWTQMAVVNTSAAGSNQVRVYFGRTSANLANTDTIQIKNVQVFDLTAMFGAGNEPTAAEFKALFPLGYYEYDEGSLLNFNGTGLKTVGFNQWDEEWEVGSIYQGENSVLSTRIRSKNYIPVFPNTTYYQNVGVFMNYYDADKNWISEESIGTPNTFTTPANCHYIRFVVKTAYGTTYNNDICINLSHSGYRNGEYEPYWTSTLDLPIATYFPTGMKSAGTAYDELTEKKAVTRIGVVDLGTLSWTLRNTNTFYASLSTKGSGADSAIGNIVCAKYTASSYNNAFAASEDKIVGINSDGIYICINDTAYTSKTAFEAAMNGVYLYYEQATPTEQDVNLSLSYLVDDYGTEQLLPVNDDEPTTSPLDAVIHYAMNAVDAILNMPNKVYRAEFDIKAQSDEHYIFSMIVGAIPSIGSTTLVGVPAGVYRAIKEGAHEYADVEIDTSGNVYINGTLDAFQAGDSSVTVTKYF